MFDQAGQQVVQCSQSGWFVAMASYLAFSSNRTTEAVMIFLQVLCALVLSLILDVLEKDLLVVH